MRPGGMGLRARLIALLLATLIPLVGLGIYWIVTEVRQEQARTERDAQETAALVSVEAGRLVSGVQGMLAVLARLPAVQKPDSTEAARLFRDLLPNWPSLENIALVGADGVLLASAVSVRPIGPIHLEDRDWFQRTIRSGQAAVGGYQVGRVAGRPIAVLSHPVLDNERRVAAVVTAGLRLAAVSQEVAPTRIKAPVVWAVADAQDLVLLHSEPWGAIGRPLGPLTGLSRAEAVVPGTPWRAVVGVPEATFAAGLWRVLPVVGLPALLVLLGAGGVALWLARDIWRPLQALTATVRRVGAGEQGVLLRVEREGELGEVAAALREALGAVTAREADLARRNNELSALVEATRAIASSLRLEEILQAIVNQAASISGTPIVRLFLLDEEAQVLRYRVGLGLPPEAEQSLVIPVGESFSGQVAATGCPMTIADCREDPRLRYPEHTTKYGLISYLGLPVRLGDRVLGVLVFNTQAPQNYSKEEVAYLSAFADQAAIAIENARLYEASQKELAERSRAEEGLKQSEEHAKRLAQENATMAEIGRIISSTLNIEEVYESFAHEVKKLIPFDRIVINSINVERNVVRNLYIAGEGLQDRNISNLYPLEGSGNAEMVRTRASVLIQTEDFRAYQDRFPALVSTFQAGFRSILNVPLSAKGQVIGGLLLRSRQPNAYTERDVRLAEKIGSQIAGTMANAQLYLENVRLYEAAQREIAERLQAEQALGVRTQHLEAIRGISEEITRELDLRAVLGLILQRTVALVGAASGSIRLWNQERQLLIPEAWTGSVTHSGTVPLRLGEGVAGTAAEKRRGLIVNDFRTSGYAISALLRGTTHTAAMATPLLYGERLVGVLTITREAIDPLFSEADLEALNLFAPHAAIAIENARLFSEEQARRRQLEAVRTVSEEIARELDLTSALELITRRAADLVGAVSGAVYLWDEVNQALVPQAWHGYGDWMGGVRIKLGEGITGIVAQRRHGMIVNDYRTSSVASPIFLEHTAITATAAEPLLYRERLIGVITINNEGTGGEFDEGDRQTLGLFATQAAIAIENARLYETAVRRGEETEALLRASGLVMAGLDLQTILDRIVTEAAAIAGSTHVRVMLLDQQAGVLRIMAQMGKAPDDQALPLESLSGLTARTGEPVFSEDAANDPRNPFAEWDRAEGIVTHISLPIKSRGGVLGVLTFNTEEPRQYTPADLAYLGAFADQAAIAIENAQLYGEIRRHAATLEDRVKERTAELEEALRVKVEFLGKMSHELRTPLNFILGFSDLLRQGVGGPLTSKQATYMDRIQTGGRRLLSLVNDVLDIAQVDAGKTRFRLEPVILGPLIQEVLGLVQVQATQKRLQVTTALDPWMPFIVADRFKLGQILQNLVANAVKFTPEDGSIRISSRQVMAAGNGGPERGDQSPVSSDSVELLVEDTGIGIQPENLETIFGAFHQVDGSETRAYGGAGLGLTLVRKLVDLHGGRVWAESAGPGQGSRFIVRLPRLEVPKAKRILLVEDEALIRIPMASALESAGFAVVDAATGADALAAMEARDFDLLILDIVLPDVDGWQVLRQVRGAEDIRTLPVLVVTGLENVNAEQALALGADEFLTKPVSPRVLLDTVVRLLAHSGVGSAGIGSHGKEPGEYPGSGGNE